MKHISEVIKEVFRPEDWKYNPESGGYWTSDLDGEEETRWVSPEEENEEQLIEAATILLDAKEI